MEQVLCVFGLILTVLQLGMEIFSVGGQNGVIHPTLDIPIVTLPYFQ
jgi:hypothetical protein